MQIFREDQSVLLVFFSKTTFSFLFFSLSIIHLLAAWNRSLPWKCAHILHHLIKIIILFLIKKMSVLVLFLKAGSQSFVCLFCFFKAKFWQKAVIWMFCETLSWKISTAGGNGIFDSKQMWVSVLVLFLKSGSQVCLFLFYLFFPFKANFWQKAVIWMFWETLSWKISATGGNGIFDHKQMWVKSCICTHVIKTVL